MTLLYLYTALGYAIYPRRLVYNNTNPDRGYFLQRYGDRFYRRGGNIIAISYFAYVTYLELSELSRALARWGLALVRARIYLPALYIY